MQGKIENWQVLDYLQNHVEIFQKSTVKTLAKSKVLLYDFLEFLIHYDKYRQFRTDFPQSRYSSHLVSPHYYPEKEFVEIFELMAARSFSAAVLVYEEGGDVKAIGIKILDCLLALPDLITLLAIKGNLADQDKREAAVNLIMEFPNVAIREFSGQLGYITGKLNLDLVNTDDILSGDWLDQLQKKVYNMALKIFKLE